MRRADGPTAALLRQLRGAARQRRQPLLTLLRRDEQTRPPADGAPAGEGDPASRAAAVGFFALLPIAVAIGVVVGRADSAAATKARCSRRCAQQDAAAATAGADHRGDRDSGEEGKKVAKASRKQPQKGQGKVVATDQQRRRSTRSPASSRARRRKRRDTKLVEENPEQVGADYIKTQQNLPDVIVVGGDPGAPPLRSGRNREPPRRLAERVGEWREASAKPPPSGPPSPSRRCRAARPARPAAGEVHDHAGRPRRRLLRDGDSRPRADGRPDPQGGRAAAGRRRAAGARADARTRTHDAAGLCPSCGAPYGHAVRFCAQCGTSLVPTEAVDEGDFRALTGARSRRPASLTGKRFGLLVASSLVATSAIVASGADQHRRQRARWRRCSARASPPTSTPASDRRRAPTVPAGRRSRRRPRAAGARPRAASPRRRPLLRRQASARAEPPRRKNRPTPTAPSETRPEAGPIKHVFVISLASPGYEASFGDSLADAVPERRAAARRASCSPATRCSTTPRCPTRSPRSAARRRTPKTKAGCPKFDDCVLPVETPDAGRPARRGPLHLARLHGGNGRRKAASRTTASIRAPEEPIPAATAATRRAATRSSTSTRCSTSATARSTTCR